LKSQPLDFYHYLNYHKKLVYPEGSNYPT